MEGWEGGGGGTEARARGGRRACQGRDSTAHSVAKWLIPAGGRGGPGSVPITRRPRSGPDTRPGIPRASLGYWAAAGSSPSRDPDLAPANVRWGQTHARVVSWEYRVYSWCSITGGAAGSKKGSSRVRGQDQQANACSVPQFPQPNTGTDASCVLSVGPGAHLGLKERAGLGRGHANRMQMTPGLAGAAG